MDFHQWGEFWPGFLLSYFGAWQLFPWCPLALAGLLWLRLDATLGEIFLKPAVHSWVCKIALESCERHK